MPKATDDAAGRERKSPAVPGPGSGFLTGAVAPLLLSLYPATWTFLRNMDELGWEVLPAPLGVSAAAALLLYGLVWLATRNPMRASVVSCAVLVSFVAYSTVLGAIPADGWRLVLWTVLSLAMGVTLWYVRLPGAVWLSVLNNIALVLVLIPIIVNAPKLTGKLRKAAGTPQAAEAGRGQAGGASGAGESGGPDIYYILLDEYARRDVLAENYGFDNGGFLGALAELGFSESPRSRANYSSTICAVPSLLNFDYVQSLVGEPAPVDQLLKRVGDAQLFRVLDERGYRIFAFPPEIYGLQRQLRKYSPRGEAGKNSRSQSLNGFTVMLLDLTPAGTIRHLADKRRSGETELVRKLEADLGRLVEIAALPDPTFTYLHLLCPHSPFMLLADGTGRTEDVGIFRTRWMMTGKEELSAGEAATYRRLYAEQVEGLNRHLLRTVRRILEVSPEPPVIVLQADHGPRIVLETPEKEGGREALDGVDVREWMATLTVAHLPGHAGLLHETVTPVNTFRLIFSAYFGLDLPALPDLNYFAMETEQGFVFSEAPGEPGGDAGSDSAGRAGTQAGPQGGRLERRL